MSYTRGNWYFYCDICGQRKLSSEANKLSTYTGRGNLIVCNRDADRIDQGLIPYKTPTQERVRQVRINHTNTNSTSPFINTETMSYQYYLSASQDNAILMASQDGAWLIVEERI